MRRFLATAAAALLLCAPTTRPAAGDQATCDRPSIGPLRYDEDWSFLGDPRCRSDFWDPLKYLPLNRDLPAYLTLGIDVRERFERYSTSSWGRDPGATSFLLQRVMPYADMPIGPHLEGFLQLTSNLVWGRDPQPLDRDDLDLLQAFGSLSFDSFTIRAGRQEIQYASSRLVSIREGPNVRLAFDGLRLIEHIRDWQFDGFVVVPVQVRPGIFDDRSEPGQSFWGLYATGPILAEWFGLDVYYLGRFRDNAVFEQGTERELRHTVGGRFWGQPLGFDYNVELAYQAGSFGAGEISAWMVASDVGYTFEALPARPRLGAQANATSGDSNPGDANLQTFNPLFPRGAYFSQANLVGPMNLVDLHPALGLQPVEGLEITLDWDFFWRESLADGLYSANTAPQVPSVGNPQRYIGSQGAVLVQWQATRHTALNATYSHFFTGPFFGFAGLRSDVDFVGLWVNYAL